jgi:hypothetical protein
MNMISWFSNQQHSPATARRTAGIVGVAILLLTTVAAVAQDPAASIPAPGAPVSAPNGYSIHQSIDVGGRFSDQVGSGAMYNTLINQRSGPRVQGQTFELHALPGTKNPPVDDLKAFSNGFGGDPENFAKLDFSKGKFYEFSGTFRRDRRYFDYDLLGNPNIPSGQSLPIGPSTAPTGSFLWPQVRQSPFMFNTVRRMTDTNLTLFPLSKVTFRIGYSQNVMQGPSLTPSGYQLGGSYSLLLQEYQRHSTDDVTAAVDWKPVQGTKLTFEEQIDHYKDNSYFTMDPAYLSLQEADGTKVTLLENYDLLAPAITCNKTSQISATTTLYANPAGGPPIIDPACNVITSYLRSEPTRAIFPTEIFRFQSSSIRNLEMNGDVRYTNANMNLPNYYENLQGLVGAAREYTGTASASAKREVMAIDYGIVWEATKTVSLEDQVTFSNAHQPGTASYTGGSTVTVPTTAGQETINNTNLTVTPATTGSAPGLPTEGGPSGAPQAGYFGQRFFTNDVSVKWDMTPRTTFSLTYRYQDHLMAEGQGTAAHNIPIPANGTTSGEVEIHENGGVFNAAFRPTNNWDINGSFEAMYNDNAITPMGFRQLRHYRMHTIYRAKSWATISGAFNDQERHNNTNNMQNFPGNTTAYAGPLDHVDYSRVGSFAAELFPNDRYGVDFNYVYSDVYMADNICYLAFEGSTSAYPGASTPSGAACGAVTRSGTFDFGPAKDFEDAPTQSGSVAFMYSPVKQVHSNLGYRISSVNGTRFYNDSRDVAGSLVSTYQSPFLDFSWEAKPGLTWKAAYNYYGYGEGGPSGAQYCATASPTATTPVTPVLCSSLASVAGTGGQTGMTISPAGETAPRNFHASNISLGVHWEF